MITSPPTVSGRSRLAAFTLIELLTVIAIIAILMGLLFPAVNAVQEAAKKAQAKNDIIQTITAIKGYYTEYSRYPTLGSSNLSGDLAITTAGEQGKLYDVLRNQTKGTNASLVESENPRGIVFFEGKDAKTASGNTTPKGGFSDSALYDPWGNFYQFVIDTDYDNLVKTGAMDGAEDKEVSTGVAGFTKGKKTGTGDADKKDDITSW